MRPGRFIGEFMSEPVVDAADHAEWICHQIGEPDVDESVVGHGATRRWSSSMSIMIGTPNAIGVAISS